MVRQAFGDIPATPQGTRRTPGHQADGAESEPNTTTNMRVRTQHMYFGACGMIRIEMHNE